MKDLTGKVFGRLTVSCIKEQANVDLGRIKKSRDAGAHR
jgi:hypothetical protein